MNVWRVGMDADEARSYVVTRPVDDLWLWWTLAGVVTYVIYKILPTKLFGTSVLVSLIELPVSVTISAIPTIWVLRRYLLNFHWKQWIVVNIVGILVAIVGLIIVLAFDLIALGIVRGIIDIVMHRPVPKDGFLSPITSVLTYATTALTFASALSIAQWRVLRQYTSEHGLGLWVSANIVSYLIAVSLSTLVKNTFGNAYIIATFGTIITALTDLIVGYALMQILRPYAPTAAPA